MIQSPHGGADFRLALLLAFLLGASEEVARAFASWLVTLISGA